MSQKSFLYSFTVGLGILSIGSFAALSCPECGCMGTPKYTPEHNHDEVQHKHDHKFPVVDSLSKLVAEVNPTEGNEEVRGLVTFIKETKGIRVKANISGLEPGEHGFHIHEYGDCTAPDGKSAGGHYNPTGEDHGGPNSTHRHIGDFGNLVADKDGNASYETFYEGITLHSMVGRGVIVHEKMDDLSSQPTGNAGARVGCGVIGISK